MRNAASMMQILTCRIQKGPSTTKDGSFVYGGLWSIQAKIKPNRRYRGLCVKLVALTTNYKRIIILIVNTS